MAVTHNGFVRDETVDFITSFLTAGSTMEFLTAGNVVVATLTFSFPAFASSSGGTAVAAAISPDTNAVGGVITKGRWMEGGSTNPVDAILFFSVTATGGGGDITLSSTTVAAGQTVSVSSLTYTHAP